jgi:hypothetical protein
MIMTTIMELSRTRIIMVAIMAVTAEMEASRKDVLSALAVESVTDVTRPDMFNVWPAMEQAKRTVTVMAVMTVIHALAEATDCATDVKEQAPLRDRPVTSAAVMVSVKTAMVLDEGRASDVTDPARSYVTSVRAPAKNFVRDAMEV